MSAEEAVPTAGTRGRRAVRPSGDDREAAILATCERLLAERPLAAISVDDLARGAGISRPTFYFYFASKDAVLLTLLDRVIAEADAASAVFAAEAATTDRRRCWREGIAAYFRTFRAHRSVTLAAAEASATNAEVRALWTRGLEGWVQTCTAAIEAERRRGAAPPGVPARDLAIVLNAMNERAMHATFRAEGPHVDGADVVDVLLEVWLSAIYGPATGGIPGGVAPRVTG